jgi:hypothetical protein
VQTTLTRQQLGPVSLAAPGDAPRRVRATHGHLWQWIGDGEELISLSVAVRETRLGTSTGVRHHLSWEVDQVRSGMDPEPGTSSVARVLIDVDGATGAAAADVVGRVRGVEVRNRIIVTTDGQHMHVVRALVPDSEEGRELSEAVTTALQVHEWSMTP